MINIRHFKPLAITKSPIPMYLYRLNFQALYIEDLYGFKRNSVSNVIFIEIEAGGPDPAGAVSQPSRLYFQIINS